MDRQVGQNQIAHLVEEPPTDDDENGGDQDEYDRYDPQLKEEYGEDIVLVVTGASRGLGRAISLAFCEHECCDPYRWQRCYDDSDHDHNHDESLNNGGSEGLTKASSMQGTITSVTITMRVILIARCQDGLEETERLMIETINTSNNDQEDEDGVNHPQHHHREGKQHDSENHHDSRFDVFIELKEVTRYVADLSDLGVLDEHVNAMTQQISSYITMIEPTTDNDDSTSVMECSSPSSTSPQDFGLPTPPDTNTCQHDSDGCKSSGDTKIRQPTTPKRRLHLIFINNAGSLGHLGQCIDSPSVYDMKRSIDLNVTSALWMSASIARLMTSITKTAATEAATATTTETKSENRPDNGCSNKAVTSTAASTTTTFQLGSTRRHERQKQRKLWRQTQIDTTIVNISSLVAVQPFPTMAIYSAGKAARDSYHVAMAKELQSKSPAPAREDDDDDEDGADSTGHIRILNYAPGPLETDMTDELRREDRLSDDLKPDFRDKQLVDPMDSARVLVRLVMERKYNNGDHLDYYDCREQT